VRIDLVDSRGHRCFDSGSGASRRAVFALAENVLARSGAVFPNLLSIEGYTDAFSCNRHTLFQLGTLV